MNENTNTPKEEIKLSSLSLKSLHEAWAAQVLHSNCPRIQREEMQKAFYSGAFSCYNHMVRLFSELPQEEASEAAKRIEMEFFVFFNVELQKVEEKLRAVENKEKGSV